MNNIDNNLYVILLLIFYIMAIYRSAILISIDTGPLAIFEWIRSKIFNYRGYFSSRINHKDGKINKDINFRMYRLFDNLDEGINCTDCTGVWSAIILGVILVISLHYHYVGIIIFIFGGAGFQYFISNYFSNQED